MIVYIDMRFFRDEHLHTLKNTFQDMTFITNRMDALDAEIAIVTPPFIQKETIKPFKHLKWIQLLTAGYDNADLESAKEKRMLVTNAQDVFSIAIAEDIISKILVFNRNIKQHVEHMSMGRWQYLNVTHDLHQSKVGILGSGSIGRETAIRLKAFGCETIGYRQKDTPQDGFDHIVTGEKGLKELLTESDYVIIALPLNEDTHHLLNDKRLSWIKDDAVIINVARGEIIDQAALIKHLDHNRFRGVGLDVTTPEPLPSTHPLWKYPNVFITPHNASASPMMSDRLFQVVFENLMRYHRQEPLVYLI